MYRRALNKEENYSLKNYLDIFYAREKKPLTDYPEKLIEYLIDTYNLKKNSYLLEAGCGMCDHLNIFKKKGFVCHGFDLEILGNNKNLNLVSIDINTQKIPFPDNYFDIIYSKSFLEHLPDPIQFLNEARRVLKDGGKILTLVPDWESQYKTFYDDFTHIRPYTKKSLGNVMNMFFSNVEVKKFRQLPISWKYNTMNRFLNMISYFIPARVNNSFLRWTRELMLISIAFKEGDND